MDSGNKIQYLTIQKAVKLMPPLILDAFKEHLEESNAAIPLKLVEAIKPGFTDTDGGDELCIQVYGDADIETKKKFNQLASYTFKLSAFVVRNFPNYLKENITQLDIMLSNGNLREANLLAEAILDIAERIHDYKAQISSLEFLSQQAYLQKSYSTATDHHLQIDTLLGHEKDLNQIYLYLRQHFNISVKDDSVIKNLDEHLNFCKQYFHHPSEKVSILGRFATAFIIHYYRPTEFLTENYNSLLSDLLEDLQRNPAITFPLLEDLLSKTIFFKLNHSFADLSRKEDKSDYNQLLLHNTHLYFWQNYVNLPELYAIAIKSTYYLSKYHSINHRKNFREIAPKDDLKDISKLIERCEYLLRQKHWEQAININHFIHLKLTYSALLMLGDEEQILKGIDTLETMMIVYQQITFSESVDSIFIILMVGYFAKKNYQKCVDTFKRYQKVSRGRVINAENQLEIFTYYYVAQWLISQRPQYLRKLQENYIEASQHKNASTIQRTILEMVSYFEIPVSL
ncbi:MAG: hypothetical protein ACK4GL_10200 [Flavobacteriales bacterium]